MAQADGLFFSKEHEWLKLDGEIGIIGITEYAQDSLGDIVYVELPRVGARVQQFGNVGVVESVKAVSDLFSPVGGEVVEINQALESDPALVNKEPLLGGWMFKVRLADRRELDRLLGAKEYEQLVAQAK